MPHAMLAAFVVLVAAILRLLFGWSTPLHVWIVLAGVAMAVLAGHAGWRAARCAGARRRRDAWLAVAFAVALGLMSAGLVAAGQAHGSRDGVFIDAPVLDAGSAP